MAREKKAVIRVEAVFATDCNNIRYRIEFDYYYLVAYISWLFESKKQSLTNELK